MNQPGGPALHEASVMGRRLSPSFYSIHGNLCTDKSPQSSYVQTPLGPSMDWSSFQWRPLLTWTAAVAPPLHNSWEVPSRWHPCWGASGGDKMLRDGDSSRDCLKQIFVFLNERQQNRCIAAGHLIRQTLGSTKLGNGTVINNLFGHLSCCYGCAILSLCLVYCSHHWLQLIKGTHIAVWFG